jgi:hypothetical protein
LKEIGWERIEKEILKKKAGDEVQNEVDFQVKIIILDKPHQHITIKIFNLLRMCKK